MTDELKKSAQTTAESFFADIEEDINNNPNLLNYYQGLIEYNLKKYSSAINHLKLFLSNDPISYDANFLLGEIYIKLGKFSQARDCLSKIVSDINSEEDFKKLESLKNILVENKQFDIAKELFSEASTIDFELCMGYPLAWEMQDIVESEMHFKELLARLEERKKVIADLSHSIKNIIGTVVDPLENLKEAKEYLQSTIDAALRGTNIVRELANAMNYSLKGSANDFFYDAHNNQRRDSQTLSDMVTIALQNSVANMFDTKYFSTFSKKYFSDRESFNLAKSDWARITDKESINEITAFIEKHLLKIDIDLKDVGNLAIGNDRGSAVKLLTIIQEMILNAVKYSAFVEPEKRFIRIKFSGYKKYVTLLVENKFKPRVKVKTTGMGHVILKNFSEMLNTALEIKNAKNIYSVKFKIPNFWEGSKV
ncbi:MAG: tetratricopeptide repeat protein [Fidelibacterota bacterium]